MNASDQASWWRENFDSDECWRIRSQIRDEIGSVLWHDTSAGEFERYDATNRIMDLLVRRGFIPGEDEES